MFGIGPPGRRPRRRRGGGHHLLRLRAGRPPDPGGAHRLRRGARAGAVHRACGATSATPPSRPRRPTTTSPPTSPARPTTSASPSRPTSSSRSSPRTTAATTRSKFGKTDPLVYDQLTTDNPIDLTRWQVVNCYAGRIGLINSGGESKGADDLAQAVRTAVINKRAGGTGPHRRAARPSSGPWPRASSSSTPSRTSSSTRRSPSPDADSPPPAAHSGIRRSHGLGGATEGTVPGHVGDGGMLGVKGRCSRARIRWTVGGAPIPRRRTLCPPRHEHQTTELDRVVIRFAGDSGDGMQLTGTPVHLGELRCSATTPPPCPTSRPRSGPRRAPWPGSRPSRSTSRTTTSSPPGTPRACWWP